MAKTILISSFHSLVSRNILSTPLITMLKQAGFNVIILCPVKKLQFFQEEFAHNGTIVEGVRVSLHPSDLAMRRLALSALRTRCLIIKRHSEFNGRGAWLSAVIDNIMGHWMVRILNKFVTPRGTFDMLLDKYQPSIIFATDVQHEYDVRLIMDAARRKINTAGMVRSWDNLTAKGLIRAIPDKLVVHNNIIKDEAINLHGIKSDIVEVIGIPHYDRYLSYKPMDRGKFLRGLGLDPSKKLILFAPAGDRYIKNNKVDCDILDLIENTLGSSAQILIRSPLADSVMCLSQREPCSGEYTDLLKKQRFGSRKDVELTSEDDRHLVDSISAADLIVAGPSTICVDAVLLKKPVILFGFDGLEKRPYKDSVRRYYDYDHFIPVRASGGVVLAESVEEFEAALRGYLHNPSRDKEKRLKLIQDQAWSLDGQATARLSRIFVDVQYDKRE